jgi:rhamnose utilization protein RhaD (predicted bifunctional aldolase and dehydrogenase)
MYQMNLSGLIDMSRKYGSDEDYVLEGGGNTSYKEGGVMAVKASGGALGTISEEGFVLMDTAKLRAMTKADYPASDDEREALAIKDMMAAREPDQGDKRPSVECILHALFAQSYVLHVHPALINGLTCSVNGADATEELFEDMGADLLWIPLTKPGFILSKACADAFEIHKEKHGAYPKILLLQNHGVFIAGDDTAGIDRIMEELVRRIETKIKRRPDFTDSIRVAFFESLSAEDTDPMSGEAEAEPAAAISEAAAALMHAYGEGGPARAFFLNNPDISRFTASEEAVAPLMRPFTPDHIVYDKAYPLWIASGTDAADIASELHTFAEAKGFKPRVALAEGLGAFTIGATPREATAAAALLVDAVKVAVYSESFGGPLALPDDFTSFILNWEIESYRQKKSLG